MATTGVWYHVTVVKTGSTLSVYVNGVLEATTAFGAFTDTHTANLRIGSYAGEGAYLNGQVDEVELFNRALSGAEIQALYNAGSGGKLKPPGAGGSLTPGLVASVIWLTATAITPERSMPAAARFRAAPTRPIRRARRGRAPPCSTPLTGGYTWTVTSAPT